MHRFFVPATLPDHGDYELPKEAAHRAVRVLRMRPGDRMRLFDGREREVEAALTSVRGAAAGVTVLSVLPSEPPVPVLDLYPALIRPNRFEWLIEKATELGVASIHPVVSEYSQVRPSEIGGARRARWDRIAVEAAEQCGRRSIPTIDEPVPLAQALNGCGRLILVPWEQERGSAPPLGRVVRDSSAGEFALFIGPEGGFAEHEINQARASGGLAVSLGPLVLRAETAAIAALAIAGDALASSR